MNKEFKTQENYESFMSELLRKVSIMKTVQMEMCLENYFDISSRESNKAVKIAQSHGFVLTTGDGYILNKGTYRYITEINGFSDQKFEGIQFESDPPIFCISNYPNFKDQNLIDAMWIIADKMPDSYDFVVTSGLWIASFTTLDPETDESYLYQIACFPANKESVNIGLLQVSDDEPHLKEWLADNREKVRRIAIIENEDHAFKFENLGFFAVVVIDESDDYGYRIINRN